MPEKGHLLLVFPGHCARKGVLTHTQKEADVRDIGSIYGVGASIMAKSSRCKVKCMTNAKHAKTGFGSIVLLFCSSVRFVKIQISGEWKAFSLPTWNKKKKKKKKKKKIKKKKKKKRKKKEPNKEKEIEWKPVAKKEKEERSTCLNVSFLSGERATWRLFRAFSAGGGVLQLTS
jgi:hypothetical protein